jgi:hypothetical protein
LNEGNTVNQAANVWGGGMLSADDALAGFIEKIKAVNEPDSLREAFNATVSDMGFRYFSYHVVRIGCIGDHLPMAITTYPQKWINHYLAEDYMKDDPVLGEGRKFLVPFQWSEVDMPEQLSKKQKRLFDVAFYLKFNQ